MDTSGQLTAHHDVLRGAERHLHKVEMLCVLAKLVHRCIEQRRHAGGYLISERYKAVGASAVL